MSNKRNILDLNESKFLEILYNINFCYRRLKSERMHLIQRGLVNKAHSFNIQFNICMLAYCLPTICRYFPRYFEDKHFSQFLTSTSKFSEVEIDPTHTYCNLVWTICCYGAHKGKKDGRWDRLRLTYQRMTHGRSRSWVEHQNIVKELSGDRSANQERKLWEECRVDKWGSRVRGRGWKSRVHCGTGRVLSGKKDFHTWS